MALDGRVLAVAIAVAAFAIVAGVGLTMKEGAGANAATNAPAPPCPGGWSTTPDGLACVRDDEACHSFLQGQSDQVVSCTALSPRGRGALRLELAGEGTAEVAVRDGVGDEIHARSYLLANGSPPDLALHGAPGAWRLVVTYHATGSGMITLWGASS